jgi:uncharacterized integral membrane protein
MSAFTLLALVLLVVVTLFALGNPHQVSVRFLAWSMETTVALAVIAAAVVGGFLVLLGNVAGQQQLRARLREAQTRVRDLEARLHEAEGPKPDPRT